MAGWLDGWMADHRNWGELGELEESLAGSVQAVGVALELPAE